MPSKNWTCLLVDVDICWLNCGATWQQHNCVFFSCCVCLSFSFYYYYYFVFTLLLCVFCLPRQNKYDAVWHVDVVSSSQPTVSLQTVPSSLVTVWCLIGLTCKRQNDTNKCLLACAKHWIMNWSLMDGSLYHPSTASVPVTALLCVTVPIKVLNKCWPRNSNYSSTQLLHKYFRLISRYLAMNISETVRDA